MILYFLLFPQSYQLYLFPHLFGLFSLLRILVCCIYLSFFPSFALSGALFTVDELIPHLSLLIGVLDKFGAVLYFQEQEKSIGPSGLDVSHQARQVPARGRLKERRRLHLVQAG